MNDSIDNLFFDAVERADAEGVKKGYTNERLITPNKVVCSGAIDPNKVFTDTSYQFWKRVGEIMEANLTQKEIKKIRNREGYFDAQRYLWSCQ